MLFRLSDLEFFGNSLLGRSFKGGSFGRGHSPRRAVPEWEVCLESPSLPREVAARCDGGRVQEQRRHFPPQPQTGSHPQAPRRSRHRPQPTRVRTTVYII